VASESGLHSRTIWGTTPPKVYSPESLQNAGFYAARRVARDSQRAQWPGEIPRPLTVNVKAAPRAVGGEVLERALESGL